MNIIKAAWKGEVKLWKIFWIGGLLPIILYYLIGVVADAINGAPYDLSDILIDHGKWAFYGAVAGLSLVNIILALWYSVSVWRCSKNVAKKFFAVISKIVIVLIVVGTIINIPMGAIQATIAVKAFEVYEKHQQEVANLTKKIKIETCTNNHKKNLDADSLKKCVDSLDARGFNALSRNFLMFHDLEKDISLVMKLKHEDVIKRGEYTANFIGKCGKNFSEEVKKQEKEPFGDVEYRLKYLNECLKVLEKDFYGSLPPVVKKLNPAINAKVIENKASKILQKIKKTPSQQETSLRRCSKYFDSKMEELGRDPNANVQYRNDYIKKCMAKLDVHKNKKVK